MPTDVSAAGRVRRRLPLRKRILFSVLAIVMAWSLIETVSLAILWGSFATPDVIVQELVRQAGSVDVQGIGQNPASHDLEVFPPEVVHPYLGYVRRPQKEQPGVLAVSEYGFSGAQPPVRRRQPGRILVAITGGSVAESLGTEAAGVLRDLLEGSPKFAGKKVDVIPLGLLSYKQPQQLLTLNYLLALGAEFDVVVNLDGFNDLVLPPLSNVENHVAPVYPWEWHLRVTRATDIESLRLMGRVTHLRTATQAWARAFDRPPFRWSPTALLIWKSVHTLFQSGAATSYKALNARMRDNADSNVMGPRATFASEDALRRHCVEIWRRSSLQMHRLCRENGILYYHFLQPNQYVPGSKPRMTAAEREVAIRDRMAVIPHVEQGYPLLRAAGDALRTEGVRFHDLSMIFAGTATPTYRDICCHLNDEGNRRMAEAIVKAISEDP